MSQMLTEKRASRGQRMAALVGQAAEDDEAFWSHDIWNEEGSDADSYEEEEEKPDVFDSDFNDSESEEESGSEDEKPVKRAKADKSQNKYQEPQKRPISAEAALARAEARAQKKLRIAVDFEDTEGPSSRTVRESTKAKTADADIARTKKAQQDKLKARPSPKLIKTQFEQRNMLLEALDTEELNKKWLIAQKMEEDERIASEKPAKAAVNESFIRFSSRRGAGNSITFTTVDAFPEILSELPAPEVPNNLCVITGKRARYRDPQTGFPYYDLAAFKELRKLYPAPRTVKR